MFFCRRAYRFYNVADRSCVATVDITGPAGAESWFRLWEEMIALEGMCTRNGMAGTSFALGKRFPKPPPPSPTWLLDTD